jgi:hypothetical protein
LVSDIKEKHRLRVIWNSVLRRIFGLKRDEVTGRWKNCIMGSFIACTLGQVELEWNQRG